MNEEIEKRQVEAAKSVSPTGLVKGELVDSTIIAGYAETLPGSPERILKMIEDQVRHRQWIEKVETISRCVRTLLGLGFAIVITLLCLGAGIFAFLLSQSIVIGMFFGFTTLGLVSRFINGTNHQ